MFLVRFSDDCQGWQRSSTEGDAGRSCEPKTIARSRGSPTRRDRNMGAFGGVYEQFPTNGAFCRGIRLRGPYDASIQAGPKNGRVPAGCQNMEVTLKASSALEGSGTSSR